MKLILTLITLITMFGCGAPLVSTKTVPPPTFDEYVDLPFNKFINRIYLDEVKNKYIKLDADFGGLWQTQNVSGYPPDKWVRISIIKGNIRFDDVMVPISEADLAFDLIRGESIAIYGKTTVWHSSYKGLKQPDRIALNVTKF